MLLFFKYRRPVLLLPDSVGSSGGCVVRGSQERFRERPVRELGWLRGVQVLCRRRVGRVGEERE